ncbi:unnamed protein product [Arabidopsis halleri]
MSHFNVIFLCINMEANGHVKGIFPRVRNTIAIFVAIHKLFAYSFLSLKSNLSHLIKILECVSPTSTVTVNIPETYQNRYLTVRLAARLTILLTA